MSGQERVLAVIKRQEPDRVPTFEIVIDDSVVKSMVGEDASYEDFLELFDLDAVMCNPICRREPAGNGALKDEWGVTRRICADGYAMAWDEHAPIKEWADLEVWQPPDPYAAFRYDTIKQQIKRFKGKKSIVLRVRDVTSNPRDLMGYVEMLMNCAECPDLVSALVEKCVDHSIAVIQVAAELGAEIVSTGDDIADSKSTLFSPQMYESLFVPHLGRLIQAIHGCGLYHWKHTDGNIMDVMDMLIEAGIDGIEPIDPLGGMDLATVKERWGDRIAIKGNVDCVDLLTEGTEEDVVESVKECIRVAGPGGGYVCASSNSIHSGVRPDLYRAMLDAVHEYGVYPLEMDKLAPAT